MTDSDIAPATSPEQGSSLSQSPARLKRKRFEAGLGLREAARLANVSAGMVSMLENGKRSASPRHLASFAELYDCKIADLMPPEDIAA